MAMQDNKRVALFHSNWVVNSQTANAIVMLAEAGYAVDLFISNGPGFHEYINCDDLRQRTNVEIYRLWTAKQTTQKSPNVPATPRRRFKGFLRTQFPRAYSFLKQAYYSYSLRRDLAEQLLLPGQVEQALKLMAGKRYRCLIGVEKGGLIWAGLIAYRLGIPLVYFNLELYIDQGDYWRAIMPRDADHLAFRCLLQGERLHHRRAAATIIQDPDRARVLFHHNGLDMSRAAIFYVPVSTLGEPYKQRSSYLHDALAIPREQKIILYFGNIWKRRYALELATVAQRFPDDWTLVMHGEGEDSTLRAITEIDRRQKVLLSQALISAERIQELIASADVGLLFYSGETDNERLTAFASEKMALYMQCGIPFVGFDYPGFRRLTKEEQCGMVIEDLGQLPEAIGAILPQPDTFRRGAHRAFEKYYCFATNFAQVVEAIDQWNDSPQALQDGTGRDTARADTEPRKGGITAPP
jgi:glycosyltransferase involved in cell wall biosynthesis